MSESPRSRAWVDVLRLHALLWYMARRMEAAARYDQEFQESLLRRRFVLQITAGKNYAYYFAAAQQQVKGVYGHHAEPTLTLCFSSARLAFQVLARGGQEAFMRGVQEGVITMQGDPAPLFWLVSVASRLRPRWRRRQRMDQR